MSNIEVTYYPNTRQVRQIKYLNADGKTHRDGDEPAKLMYHENGMLWDEIWIKDGKTHRENAPAHIWYHENGKLSGEQYLQNGELHREDGPANINYEEDGTTIYEIQHWIRGKAHKDDGPSSITYIRGRPVLEGYWKNGVLEKSIGLDEPFLVTDGSDKLGKAQSVC